MAIARTLCDRLIEALPSDFNFYHLGEVRRQETPSNPLHHLEATSPLGLASSDRLAVAFSLHGDAKGALVLIFDQGLDVSTYSEVGNIIASRMSTHLSESEGLDVMISPPRVLSNAQIQGFLRSADAQSRTYHHHPGRSGQPARFHAVVVMMEGNQ